jgi:hypothetical protein
MHVEFMTIGSSKIRAIASIILGVSLMGGIYEVRCCDGLSQQDIHTASHHDRF